VDAQAAHVDLGGWSGTAWGTDTLIIGKTSDQAVDPTRWQAVDIVNHHGTYEQLFIDMKEARQPGSQRV